MLCNSLICDCVKESVRTEMFCERKCFLRRSSKIKQCSAKCECKSPFKLSENFFLLLYGTVNFSVTPRTLNIKNISPSSLQSISCKLQIIIAMIIKNQRWYICILFLFFFTHFSMLFCCSLGFIFCSCKS